MSAQPIRDPRNIKKVVRDMIKHNALTKMDEQGLKKIIEYSENDSQFLIAEGKLVVKLSGSLFPHSAKALKRIRGIITSLEDLHKMGLNIVAVAGGGIVARDYISLGRKLGGDESSLDQMGIDVSRLNAKIMALNSQMSYPKIPTSLDEIALALNSSGLIFTGGLSPGQSTNATAALISEKIGAQIFINATDVDGVYSKDPRKGKGAKLLKNVSTSQLIKMLSADVMRAGTYELMDLVALKILERSKIPCRIIRCDPKLIRDAALGSDVGTLISGKK